MSQWEALAAEIGAMAPELERVLSSLGRGHPLQTDDKCQRLRAELMQRCDVLNCAMAKVREPGPGGFSERRGEELVRQVTAAATSYLKTGRELLQYIDETCAECEASTAITAAQLKATATLRGASLK